MGLFGKSRITLSPEQLGASVVVQAMKTAFDGDESLYTMLLEAGMPVSNEFYSETEAAIFALLPFDIVIAGKFGPGGWAIREAMHKRFVEFTKMRLSPADAERVPWNTWPDYVQQRFDEYVAAMKSQPGGDGLRAMSTLAYRRISGDDRSDPQAYMIGSLILGRFFSAAYSAVPKDLDNFQIA